MPEGLTAISTGVRWFKKRRRPCKKFITYSLCQYTWFCILYNAQEAREEPAGNQWRTGAWQWALCTLRGLPLIVEEVVLPIGIQNTWLLKILSQVPQFPIEQIESKIRRWVFLCLAWCDAFLHLLCGWIFVLKWRSGEYSYTIFVNFGHHRII